MVMNLSSETPFTVEVCNLLGVFMVPFAHFHSKLSARKLSLLLGGSTINKIINPCAKDASKVCGFHQSKFSELYSRYIRIQAF